MQSVFANSDDLASFERRGFIRKQLLNAGHIEELKKLYQAYFPNGTEKFFSSTFIKDVNLKKEISEKLTGLLMPEIEKHFTNYKLLGAQFLIKNPGEQGQMPFHQDWQVVDETQHRSLTVWIGLQDIDENNGPLKAIPGSQQFSREIRGPGNFGKLVDIQQLLDGYSQTLLMKAGEAFIFDHSLIHGSGVNTGANPRLAVALGLVHKDADLFFYHKNAPASFEKYSVAPDFFITFPNDGNAPQGARLLELIPFDFEKTKPGNFIQRMQEITETNRVATKQKPLFADTETQAKFEKDGFVKLNLLNEAEVKTLKDYYLSLNHNHIGEYGFHISLENKSKEYVNGVFKTLFNTVLPKLNEVLLDYKAFTASYVIKEAGLQNIVPPHQDWTFVDEEEFTSATVWIPLMEVNKNNGALGIIKGSHKVFNYPRASPSPQSKSLLSDHAFNLFPYVEVIEMKAGEALVFNNKTIHASPPNISNFTRIAAGIGITQKNAQLLHYYQVPGTEENVDVYAVDETFFLEYNNSTLSALFNKGEKPQNLKRILSYKKTNPDYTKKEITELVCRTEGVKINTALMQELAALYNYNPDGTPKNNTKTSSNMANSNETNQANAAAGQAAAQPVAHTQAADTRTFFQKYTPSNIVAEIKYRLRKK